MVSQNIYSYSALLPFTSLFLYRPLSVEAWSVEQCTEWAGSADRAQYGDSHFFRSIERVRLFDGFFWEVAHIGA